VGAVKSAFSLVIRLVLLIRESPSLAHLPLAKRSGKVLGGGGMAANRQQVVCVQCDKNEEYCTCEKYCTICKGQTNVRLCVDGLYYCPDCREACDVALANQS
jgi:hypothetical protein